MNIIELAKEAGYFLYDLTETHGIKTVETDESDQWAQLERFAALITAQLMSESASIRAEREWVDLTDDEIEEIGKSYFDEWSFGFARAVIAADREKNK